MLLTDPLEPDVVRVLRLVRSAYRDGRWPTWQWLRWRAGRGQLDAEALLTRLPAWQLHYRPIRLATHGHLDPAAEVALTVHGLAAADDTELVPVFLAALAVASEHQAACEPDPYALTPLHLSGDLLTDRVKQRSGRRQLSPAQLRSLLEHEPATWQGHSDDAGWTWELTRAPLHLFRGVTLVEDYLERLDTHLVGVRSAAPMPAALPPLAVLDALDHLDSEWAVRTRRRLLRLQRTAAAALLSQPVNSAAEMEAACSAFADLLNHLQPQPATPKQGTLNQLAQRLTEELPAESAERACRSAAARQRVARRTAAQRH